MSMFEAAKELDADDWYDAAIAQGMGFKTPEERQAYIASLGDPLQHPFWADSYEEMGDHPLKDAFRCLREEDKTNVELAGMYKDEGNEWIKKSDVKSLREAMGCYTHALSFLDKADEEDANMTVCEVDEQALETRRRLRSQLLSNRALASLTLRNYGTCRRDCEEAIRIWNGNAKAHYRRCKSLVMVRKFDQARTACNEALDAALGSGGGGEPPKDILALLATCDKEQAKLQVLEENKARAIAEQEAKWQQAWDICASVGVKIAFVNRLAQPEQLKQHGSCMPFFDQEEGVAKWPLLFLYPQHNQLDVVQAADASDMLAEHLASMFPELEDGVQPVCWDATGEYQVSRLCVYLQVDASLACVESCEEWLAACREPEAFTHLVGKKKQGAASSSSDSICFLDCHLGCTIKSLLKARHLALPGGLLTLIVFVRGNKAHERFVRDNEAAGNQIVAFDPSPSSP